MSSRRCWHLGHDSLRPHRISASANGKKRSEQIQVSILFQPAKTLTRKCGISSSFSSCATPRIARALGLWSTTMRFREPPRPPISRLRPRPRPACTDPGSIFPRPRPRPVGGLISPSRVAWKQKRADAKTDSLSHVGTEEPSWPPPARVKKIIISSCWDQMVPHHWAFH